MASIIDRNIPTRELIAKKNWDGVAARLSDLKYLEERVSGGQVYDLLAEMQDAAAGIPARHAAAKVLRVLERGLRENAAFLARRPSATFQCFWNSCYVGEEEAAGPVSGLMGSWRRERDAVWIESHMPATMTAGDNLLIDIVTDAGSCYPVGLALRQDHVAAWFRQQDDTIEQRVWRVQTGEPVVATDAGEWPFPDPSVSPDQRYKATCGGKGGGWGHPIRITDRQTGAEVAAQVDDDHKISGPVFSGDGRFVAAAGDGIEYEGYLYIWELQAGRVRVAPLQCGAHAVAFSPDGRRIATGYSNGLIEILTRASAKVRTSFSAHDEWIALLAFSPDGKRIASITSGGCLRVWDPAVEPTEKKFSPHPDELAEAVFSPNGDRLVTRSMNGTLWLWEGNTGRPIRCLFQLSAMIQEGGYTRQAVYVGDDTIVSVARGGGEWTAGDGVPLTQGRAPIFSRDSIQFTADGKRFALWTRQLFEDVEAVITVHDLWATDSHGEERDGDTHEMSITEDGEIHTRRLPRRVELARIETNATDIDGCAFSSDQRLLAAAGEEGWLKVWDWKTGTEVFSAQIDRRLLRKPTPPNPSAPKRRRKAERVRFVDEDTLAVAVGETHVQLWNFRSGKRLKTAAWEGTLSEYLRQAPYHVVRRAQELCVVSRKTGEEVAWFPCEGKPNTPLDLIAHPNGRAWVGLLDTRLIYFSLAP